MKTNILIVAFVLFFFSGCAGTLPAGGELDYCQYELCARVKSKKEMRKLTENLYHLIKKNENQKFSICEADPETKQCISDGVSASVIAIPPGTATATHAIYRNVRYDSDNLEIRMSAHFGLTFMGIPATCSPLDLVLKPTSNTDFAPSEASYNCNWMVVGAGAVTLVIDFNYFNFDEGVMGAYYTLNAIVTTGVGTGEGYLTLKIKESDKVEDFFDPYRRKSFDRDEEELPESSKPSEKKSMDRD
jgi:hypothetical protein